MKNHLYFICPTDFLEAVINKTFKQENYFLTSLGNSMSFDIIALGQIKELIVKKNILEITFILSDDNQVLSGNLKNKSKLNFDWLNGINHQIITQKKTSQIVWSTKINPSLIVSYHLHNKIKELRQGLGSLFIDQLRISGKIYNREQNSFDDIFSDLFCIKHFNLN